MKLHALGIHGHLGHHEDKHKTKKKMEGKKKEWQSGEKNKNKKRNRIWFVLLISSNGC